MSSIGKVGFTPGWRKDNVAESLVTCYVSEFNEVKCRATKLVGERTVCSVFGMPEPDQEDSSSNDIPLCHYHYGILYRHMNPSHLNCKTCGRHISDFSKSRPVPEANTLEAFLLENTEFSGSFSATDRVCLTCYKSHLCVIKHLKGSIRSIDEELTLLLNELKMESHALTSNKTLDNAIAYTSTVAALRVGETLLKQSATLLPVVYAQFKTHLMNTRLP